MLNDVIIFVIVKFYEFLLVIMDLDFKKVLIEEGVECVCGLGNGGDLNG